MKSIRATRMLPLLLASSVLISLPGCTDLKESPTSSITPENFYGNDAEVLGGLASVYATMRSTLDDYYNVSQVSADEHIVPTRGSDWYDNGRWLEMDRQVWSPSSTVGLQDLNGVWNALFTGVARANVVLSALEKVSVANKPRTQGELRALRAFYYYLLMDMFGGVPIVTTTEVKAQPQATRAAVFKFIEDELTAARADLPVSWPLADNGRLTKGAADAILASMYVNAQVFTGTARWADAVIVCDRILSSSAGYLLSSNWRSNFTADNNTSPEIIMAVKFAAQADLGLNFVMRSSHYAQFNPSPWNGFATIAEVYNAFDANDIRRQIFLVGPQVNLDPASPNYNQPVNDRSGNPLVFTTSIADPTQATEGEGARIMKWPPDPNHVQQENGNDFAYFRLAEIYLIKAEALNEQNLPGALLLVNTVRARGFPGDASKLLPAMSQGALRDAIFQERLFELTAEAKRRQDLIRAGKYTEAWRFKLAREAYRILMPIPKSQLETNPNLKQNPGY